MSNKQHSYSTTTGVLYYKINNYRYYAKFFHLNKTLITVPIIYKIYNIYCYITKI